MSEPLDELYLKWLYSQVGDPEAQNPIRTYWKILRQLFTKEFVWIVPNDDNRVQDGKDLRHEFAAQTNLTITDQNWMMLGCSIFELLVGLSRRLAFQCEGEPRDWFWHLMGNLQLIYCDKKRYSEQQVDAVLERLIWRQYESDGVGGLFPLKRADKDQRQTEIWNQMCAYIFEMN